MSEYIDPGAYARLNALSAALTAAWVLLGRCDATLEALASPRTTAAQRRAIIQKMRAEIAKAVGETK